MGKGKRTKQARNQQGDANVITDLTVSMTILLEAARTAGLAIGTKSIATVIYDKTLQLKADKSNAVDVINDIKKFCEVGIATDTEAPVNKVQNLLTKFAKTLASNPHKERSEK